MRKKPVATSVPSLEDIQAMDILKKPETILALDISGTCVGWALGADRQLVVYGKHVFKTTATQGEKIVSFAEFVTILLSSYSPDTLVLEEPLHRAKVRKHFEFLGVLRYLWYLYKGEHLTDDHTIDPRKVKKHLHVSPGKTHTENKRRMVDKINTLYGLNLAFHSNSAYKSDDDIADAIAVLATRWRLHGSNSR